MANEINVSAALQVSKGNLLDARQFTSSPNLNANSPACAGSIVSVPTAAAVIPLGNVATNGWAIFKNLDANNFVEVGVVVSATFYPVAKMKPGEPALFRVSPSCTPYGQANIAPVKLQYNLYDD